MRRDVRLLFDEAHLIAGLYLRGLGQWHRGQQHDHD
jgi:hypothetical protein